MDSHLVLVALHLLGFAFGVGGATASDLIFVRTIKDGKVTREEYNLIKTVSTVVWASVIILILSGSLLVWLEQINLGEIPRLSKSFFQLKMTAFGLLFINGIIFHKRVFPLLNKAIDVTFRAPEIRAKYGLFAVTGGLSIVSWYTAFLAVAFARVLGDYSYLFLVNIYAFLVAGAGLTAYLLINMHADEVKNPLKGVANIISRRFTLSMILILAALAGGIIWQATQIFA